MREAQPDESTRLGRKSPPRWLNSTVVGIGLASLFSDWSHEIATAILPMFIATMSAAPAWLGVIEGVADGVSGFTKMASGYFTDRLPRRKGIALAGYLVTALGTASIALATQASHVLLSRVTAWLGRGVRTPVRKALLAGSVTRDTYGRAFGFERMMDTVGAIAGSLTALFLIKYFHGSFPSIFAITLIPGLIAVLCIGLLVREQTRVTVKHVSFGESLRTMPVRYRKFVIAVSVFGLGDFSHTLLILLAVNSLAPEYGSAMAMWLATLLYLARNLVYAGCSMFTGVLADKFSKGKLLVTAYLLAALMALIIALLPMTMITLAFVFIIGGIYFAMQETLEDAFCAELVEESHHGMAFGVLATVNGIGDLVSSVMVGLLWTAMGVSVAFGCTAIIFVCGAVLVMRVLRTDEPLSDSLESNNR